MINCFILRYSIFTYTHSHTHILPTWGYSHPAASPRFLQIIWPKVRRFFKHFDGSLGNIRMFVDFYPPNSEPRFQDYMGRNVFDPKKPDGLGKKAADFWKQTWGYSCVLLAVFVSPAIRIFTTHDYWGSTGTPSFSYTRIVPRFGIILTLHVQIYQHKRSGTWCPKSSPHHIHWPRAWGSPPARTGEGQGRDCSWTFLDLGVFRRDT